MTYAKHCCNACASSGMGDLTGVASSVANLTPTEKAIGLAMMGLGIAAATLAFLAKPHRSRPRSTYSDPQLRETQRLPRESMADVVWERRR